MTRNGPAIALYAVAAYAFLHLPLLVLAVFSFNSSRFTRWEGFSLTWYRAAFADGQLAEATFNSLLIGFAATAPLALEGGKLVVKIWTAARRADPAKKTPVLESAQ